MNPRASLSQLFDVVRWFGQQYSLLTVPGWGGSDADHWQTGWERAVPSMVRVEQDDWESPHREAWVDGLTKALASCPRPPILLAHSLGCSTVVWASALGRLKGVAGAFLVAIPDADRDDFPSVIQGYRPMPRPSLGFPSVLVASQDDPFLDGPRAKLWADLLGSDFFDAGARHHLGSVARLGDWVQGLEVLVDFLRRLGSEEP